MLLGLFVKYNVYMSLHVINILALIVYRYTGYRLYEYTSSHPITEIQLITYNLTYVRKNILATRNFTRRKVEDFPGL